MALGFKEMQLHNFCLTCHQRNPYFRNSPKIQHIFPTVFVKYECLCPSSVCSKCEELNSMKTTLCTHLTQLYLHAAQFLTTFLRTYGKLEGSIIIRLTKLIHSFCQSYDYNKHEIWFSCTVSTLRDSICYSVCLSLSVCLSRSTSIQMLLPL